MHNSVQFVTYPQRSCCWKTSQKGEDVLDRKVWSLLWFVDVRFVFQKKKKKLYLHVVRYMITLEIELGEVLLTQFEGKNNNNNWVHFSHFL
jgi:hypothetical protein